MDRTWPPPFPGRDLGFAYFRLPSVRSADNLATKAAPHQLEAGPPLIAFRPAVRPGSRIAGEGVAVTLAQIRVASSADRA